MITCSFTIVYSNLYFILCLKKINILLSSQQNKSYPTIYVKYTKGCHNKSSHQIEGTY